MIQIAYKPKLTRPRVTRMTVCAGMHCTDGIVLCADALESIGTIHREVIKLKELPIVSDGLRAMVVCSTDNGVFADALMDKISDALNRSDDTFSSAKRAIENATRGYCEEIWKSFDASQPKPSADVLIGLKTVDDLRLLHISAPIVRTIETWEFIGYGSELGIYKAGQYGLKDMPTDTAAPILAYIVDIVKANVQFCGRSTSLAILHPNGDVEHKSQEYIAKTTQGYKSIGWLLDTWVFPFLPLFVSEAGEDVLSMIGKLGEPKTDWVQKIPWMLQFLKDRKTQILAGEIPAISENQKQKSAFNGIPCAARILQNASKKLHEQNLLGEDTKASLDARCALILELSEIINAGIDSGGAVDQETIREQIERICLFFTTPPSVKQLMFEETHDQPPHDGEA
jgi:hypothetical protein